MSSYERRVHQRLHNGLSAKFEKRLMIWVAERTPLWISPDHLTALGLLGAVIVAVGNTGSAYSPFFLIFAALGIVLNWIGDSLDGTLARHRNIERPLVGFYVDHVTDLAAQFLIILSIGATPFVRFDIAALFLAAYCLISAYTYIFLYVSNIHVLSQALIGPTELRIVYVILYVLVFFDMHLKVSSPFAGFSPFDLLIGAGSIVIIATTFISAVQNMRLVRKLEAQSAIDAGK